MNDIGPHGHINGHKNKIEIIDSAINNKITVKIEYLDKCGEKSTREIEPRLLIFKKGEWYVYAFCHKRADFRMFRINRIRTATFLDKELTRGDTNLKDKVAAKEYKQCKSINEVVEELREEIQNIRSVLNELIEDVL